MCIIFLICILYLYTLHKSYVHHVYNMSIDCNITMISLNHNSLWNHIAHVIHNINVSTLKTLCTFTFVVLLRYVHMKNVCTLCLHIHHVPSTSTCTSCIHYVNRYNLYPLCTDVQYMHVYICVHSRYVTTLCMHMYIYGWHVPSVHTQVSNIHCMCMYKLCTHMRVHPRW